MIGPWEFALVALAAWRTFHLLAWDSILDRPRAWVIAACDKPTRPLGEAFWSKKTEDFIECTFCLGFWVALAWVVAFWVTPNWAIIVAVPLAVSASVSLMQIVADALTD